MQPAVEIYKEKLGHVVKKTTKNVSKDIMVVVVDPAAAAAAVTLAADVA